MNLSGRQSIRLADGTRMAALPWLLEIAFRPTVADSLPTFRIDHPELLEMVGWAESGRKYFSWDEIKFHLSEIHKESTRVQSLEGAHSVFEKKLLELHNALTLYNGLIHSFRPLGTPAARLQEEYAAWAATIPPGLKAIRAQESNQDYSQEALSRFVMFADRYLELSKAALLRLIPFTQQEEHWLNIGQALLDVITTDKLPNTLIQYSVLAANFEANEATAFNETLQAMHADLAPHIPAPWRMNLEGLFNRLEPFYCAMLAYGYAFLLILTSWLLRTAFLRSPISWMLGIAFTLHTAGLVMRMLIQGRPPVTNLYASSIFVGWAAVGLSLLMERFSRQGIAQAAACLIGFATLVIAHQLAASSDTLEMVRAVLDSNFWLSTHVVCVTLGYSAMFLAGAFAIFYVIAGVFTQSLTTDRAQNLTRMIYATLCFALLFSFVGTLLGGIWADQSWGRFWGWDPKENGALLIVLWVALILHARWGGLVKARGLALMALFGNIVTSWSWFGTNMLGVGLHSYGFMDQAFWALAAFIASQLILIALGALPKRMWRSQA
ncbi:MAG: hypothetical protein B7X06_02630 [Verrucomicrobia bacterium 21-51-4]|nr:MAG: hypothetical protein B7X06_02630 [Verrucomicrobia bacterium 21-51-4]